MVLHYVALSATWQDQVLNTLTVNKHANGLKARALVHRKNNLTGTKSSVKLSTDDLAWKYEYEPFNLIGTKSSVKLFTDDLTWKYDYMNLCLIT